ncbi:hypothetical protein LXA43DRAFT_1105034 [Ganoderma leucocontextum]|nr:hypothetical protein LXA43DRAFT_1105034 [Ganoderma leucocontextum]
MIVSEECYKIFASILNEFGRERAGFTFADFIRAARGIGFGIGRGHVLTPPTRFGNQIFRVSQKSGKLDRVVSEAVQDQWKKELFKLYGWTADTFRTRCGADVWYVSYLDHMSELALM